MKEGVWRYNPLPSPSEVERWYKEAQISDDERVWQSFFDWNLRWLDAHSIVDIGAGQMAFVNYANSRGKKSVGVDLHIPTPRPIHLYSYEEFENLSQRFEAGRMRLVLEHILDPVSFLSYWRQRVDKLLIIVPNEFNPLQIKLITKYGYSPVSKYHLSYFKPHSLNRVCDAAGWQVVRRSATFPMELFVTLGFNYIDNPKLGDYCHELRLKFEKSFGPLAFDLYDYWFRRYGWGRELVYLCESSPTQ